MVFTATSRVVLEEIDKAWRCKVTIRVASCVVSVVAIICLAWSTATGPHEADYHVWDWQTVPWDFLSVRLQSSHCSCHSIALLDLTSTARPLHNR